MTVRYGKFFPYATPETVTISSILMGFLYGPKIGAVYALAVGLYAYVRASDLKLTSLTLIALAAMSAVIADALKGWGFTYAVIGSVVLRNAIGLPIYMFWVYPNPPQNISQHACHTFLNVAVYFPVVSVIFKVITLF